MHKHYGSNYSLWPEQARPRRAIPLTLEVGGLAIGIVCGVAGYNVVNDFLHFVSTQEVLERTVAEVPSYATVAGSSTGASRTRSSRVVAKVTLPIIGTRAITQSRDTDGRGGDKLMGETAVATSTAPPASQPTLIENPEPADKPSTEVSERKTKPAALSAAQK